MNLTRSVLPLPDTYGGEITELQAEMILTRLSRLDVVQLPKAVSLGYTFYPSPQPVSTFRWQKIALKAAPGWGGYWYVAVCDELPRTWVAGPVQDMSGQWL